MNPSLGFIETSTIFELQQVNASFSGTIMAVKKDLILE